MHKSIILSVARYASVSELAHSKKYPRKFTQELQGQSTSAADKKKAVQQINKYTKQLAQMKSYDEAMAHIANQRIEIDLDDGVKVNYEKFQGV